MARVQLDLPGFRGLTPAPPAAVPAPTAPEPPPVPAPVEQLRQLAAELAEPPRWVDTPAPPPVDLHRPTRLPSVVAQEARIARVAEILFEVGPRLDALGVWLAERLGRLQMPETVEAGDLTYLEVVVIACRAEGAALEDVLRKGAHTGTAKLARNRAWYDLYLVLRSYAELARVWGTSNASVRTGVLAHDWRVAREGVASPSMTPATPPVLAANSQWVELDDGARAQA